MSEPLFIKIKADETMVSLAKEAIAVQDACNLCGVAQGFAKAMLTLHRHPSCAGSDWLAQHPVTKSWVDKLQHLARLPQKGFSFEMEEQGFQDASAAHQACYQLARGEDVQWTIIPMF